METKYNRENLHIHTKYSWDCDMELKDIVTGLIDNGVNIAALTDHVEPDREELKEVIEKFKIRNFEIDKLNDEYKGKIKLLKGMEITLPNKYPKYCKELNKLDNDVIMGSVHKVPRANSELERINYTYQYYQQILDMVNNSDIDIVGHLDYINRYFKTDHADYKQLCDIFMAIKHNNMVLEMNASANRRCNQLCFPEPKKLKIYSAMVKEVTIGTDAHQKDELIDNLEKTEILATSLNLKQVYFEKRKKKVLNPPTYS